MAESSTSKKWIRRSLFALITLAALIVLIIVSLRVFLLSESGRNYVESQINQSRLGTVERVEISDLEGDLLKDFSIGSVKVYDETGIWATAEDISVQWDIWSLPKKVIDIESLNIAASDILRAPKLNSSSNSDGPSYSMRLSNGLISELNLSDTLIGLAAQLRVKAEFKSSKEGAIKSTFDLLRLDENGESFLVDFERSSSGEMNGNISLTAKENGAIARLLQAPENTLVTAEGQLRGDNLMGSGDLKLLFGQQTKSEFDIQWNKRAANLSGLLSTSNWPLFNALTSSLGDQLNIGAQIDRTSSDNAFIANIQSDPLSMNAAGILGAEPGLPDFINLALISNKPNALIPLPPEYTLETAKIEGLLTLKDKLGFDGTLNLNALATPYAKATALSGPMRLIRLQESDYEIKTSVTLRNLVTLTDLPVSLSQQTKINFDALVNPSARTAQSLNLLITNGDNKISAKGNVLSAGDIYNLTGNSTLNYVDIGPLTRGRIKGSYRVEKRIDTLPAVTTRGVVSFDDVQDFTGRSILGSALNFDVKMSPTEDGVTLSQADISGEFFTAALQGQITDSLDIVGEIKLVGPQRFNTVELPNDMTASLLLQGPRNDPIIKIEAETQKIITPQLNAEDIRLRSEIRNVFDTPEARLRLNASSKYGAIDLETRLQMLGGELRADDIQFNLGRFSVIGDLTRQSNGLFYGKLQAVLPKQDEQFARLTLLLGSEQSLQQIDLNAEAENIAFKAWNIDKLSADLSGTLSNLNGKIDVQGAHGMGLIDRDFKVISPITLSKQNEQFRLMLLPEAQYGTINLSAKRPVIATYENDNISLLADIDLVGSPLSINYKKLGATETLQASLSEIPIRLLPLPSTLSETRGRLSSIVSLSSNPQSGVTGTIENTLNDWRGFEITADNGIDAQLDLNLASQNVDWILLAEAQNSFTASGKGAFQTNEATIMKELRPNLRAPMQGKIDIAGSFKPLLQLITPKDAEPDGSINSSLVISGTPQAPLIEGTASGQKIRFEAPELGTLIRDGRFSAKFSNDNLRLEDVYASDNNGGTLSGRGEFKLGELRRPLGQLSLKTNEFLALNRKDFQGRISGQLDYVSKADTSLLKGDLTLSRAEIKQFVSGRASVVEIPVMEINIPEDRAEEDTIEVPALPINLDIKFKAPRRIFVRTRGLDVELAIDSTIKGTLGKPEIYGEASVLRGGYRIAGKELSFESGSITFDGEVENARVNLIAETSTQNIEAKVTISGTVGKPEITLSSTPERPQDEILSALLFGRSATELSAIEAAQLAGALAQFSGAGGGFDLLGGLRDALGVGQLSIGVSENGAAQITGGRYLAKNVYLQVFSGAGTDQTGAVIDWEIQKNISLRSRVQADNEQSFSLKWKKDF